MGKCICPNCKSKDIIPIIYGYPTPETMKSAEVGTIKYFAYPMRSREILDKEITHIQAEKVNQFYNEIMALSSLD